MFGELHTWKGNIDPKRTAERYPEDLVIMTVSVEDTVIGNTGVSCHLFNTDGGMKDVVEIEEKVAGICGNNLLTTLKGRILESSTCMSTGVEYAKHVVDGVKIPN